jgi:hypothetical protein
MSNNIRWNNYAMDYGFLQFPNLLIDYHEEIGIDEKELMFLLKLSRHKEDFKVHDNQVIKGNQKTAQRRRNSLKKKGLLEWQQHKESYYENGNEYWITTGFTYDLSYLNQKLQDFYDKLQMDKTVLDEDKIVPGEDKKGVVEGQGSPAYNTSYNTSYNTINTTIGLEELNTTTEVEGVNINTIDLDESVIAAYKQEVDPDYIEQPADIKYVHNFKNKEQLLKYIPYWNKYIGNHPDMQWRLNTLDEYDKKHSARICVMIKHWNKFRKFAEGQIIKEERLEEGLV